MPIWGGNETLAKARAIENHVWLGEFRFTVFRRKSSARTARTLAAAPERGKPRSRPSISPGALTTPGSASCAGAS